MGISTSCGSTKYKKTRLPSTASVRDCLEYPTSLLRRQGLFSRTSNQEPKLRPLWLLNIKVEGSVMDGLVPKLEKHKSDSDLENTHWSLPIIITPFPLWWLVFPVPFHLFYSLWVLNFGFSYPTWRQEARTLRIGARCFTASARSQHQESGSSEHWSRTSNKSVISSLFLWSSWGTLLQTGSLSILELDTEVKFSKASLKWSWRTGLKYWRRDFT